MGMGKSNAVVRTYVSKKDRFADLFNYALFKGFPVIKAEDLVMIDGENDLVIDDTEGNEMEIHRYRDITMRWKHGATFTILACENQEKVNYTMPVRTMLYDSLNYVDQIKEIEHRADRKQGNSKEFLSKFKKDDRLSPIVTIVLYYGLEEWDASVDLYGMLDVNEELKESEAFKGMVPNYRINLIDVGRIGEVEKFQTDLQMMFGMLQYRSNTEKLEEYIQEHREYFECVGKDDYLAMREFLHSKSKLKKALKVIKDKKEGVNVCKAIDGIYDNGVKAGKEMMQKEVQKAEAKVQEAEAKVQEAEVKVQEAEAKVQEAEAKVWNVAAKMLEKMDASEVAELLNLDIEIVQKLK